MHLEALSRLKNLGLKGTQVSDAGLVALLKGLIGIKTLGLSDTQMTDNGMAHLKDLTNLEVLH